MGSSWPQKRPVGPGRHFAPGTRHRFWNDGDEEAHTVIAARSPLRLLALFEAMYGLIGDGKLKILVRVAVVLREYRPEVQSPDVLQKAVLGVLAPIGTLLGHQTRYANYRDEA